MDTIQHTKYEESIEETSLWITATPTATTLTLPFYIMEAGHFLARQDYMVKREYHNSFLLLYTISGEGTLSSAGNTMFLSPGSCAVIDCHKPHEYYSTTRNWEFMWIHYNGSGAAPMLDILYPGDMQPILPADTSHFEEQLVTLLKLTQHNDIASCMETSAGLHLLFQLLLFSLLETERSHQKATYSMDIDAAVTFIRKNYSHPITIDDIIRDIPISKYHFIRLFRRIMGVTPYSYLMNYRINRSKILLRSTDKSIAEIAETCGFSDTSNFISQFKKHTGIRPTHYRKDFLWNDIG